MAVSANGALATFNIGANSYLVGDTSGSWSGATILSLLSPGAFGGNDNRLSIGNPHLTGSGLVFSENDVGDDRAGNVTVYYSAESHAENSTSVVDNSDFQPLSDYAGFP
jgi:hypothetical protein